MDASLFFYLSIYPYVDFIDQYMDACLFSYLSLSLSIQACMHTKVHA